MKKPTWSYSALKLFEQCPRQYHEVRILKKHPFPDTEQIRYGKELHKAAEDYVKDGAPIPEQFAFVKPTIDALLTKPGRKLAEYQMALTEDLRPCEWFSDEVWVRGVADLLIVDDDNLTAWVVDYKTGNNKYPDTDQLTLMELMVFAHFPHVRQVNSALLFVVKESMVKHKMQVEESEKVWWRYRERIAKLSACIEHDVWTPQSSPLCPWCPVKSCEFHPKH